MKRAKSQESRMLAAASDKSKLLQNIEQSDRIAIKGKNGSGKSTLLKLLCGENIKYCGTLEKGSNLKISYVSQDTSYLREVNWKRTWKDANRGIITRI